MRVSFVTWRPRRPGDLRRALAFAGVAVLAILVAPVIGKLGPFLPECNFHNWTGVACPSCGATRAAEALARGRFVTALRWNPLVASVAAASLAAALAGPLVVLLVRRVPEIGGRIPAVTWWCLAAAILANWVYLVVAGV